MSGPDPLLESSFDVIDRFKDDHLTNNANLPGRMRNLIILDSCTSLFILSPPPPLFHKKVKSRMGSTVQCTCHS
jgi:hypothetical protein